MQHTLKQRLLAESLGTLLLLCTVIGSGIMAQQLSQGNTAVALLGNTFATVFILYVLIETLGPVSGAHFNPLVTVLFHAGSATEKASYIAAQCVGAVLGAWLAHAMFDLSILQLSTTVRGDSAAWGQWLAEVVATAGLVFVIARSGATGVHAKASGLVACYIGAAYWFTASTSFANPVAVLGRMMSDSFAGIAPASALGFVVAQCVGAFIGWRAEKTLAPTTLSAAKS
jgi:glycerol uptake facilitator-like aquaporin